MCILHIAFGIFSSTHLNTSTRRHSVARIPLHRCFSSLIRSYVSDHLVHGLEYDEPNHQFRKTFFASHRCKLAPPVPCKPAWPWPTHVPVVHLVNNTHRPNRSVHLRESKFASYYVAFALKLTTTLSQHARCSSITL